MKQVQFLNSVQHDIVTRLRDMSKPRSSWKTFLVKKKFDQLTPFITFPGPRVVLQLDYVRQSKREQADHLRQDWVLRKEFGYEVYRINTVLYKEDPEAELTKLVAFLWKSGKKRMESTKGEIAWADDIEQAQQERMQEPFDDIRKNVALLNKIKSEKQQFFRDTLASSRMLRGESPWVDNLEDDEDDVAVEAVMARPAITLPIVEAKPKKPAADKPTPQPARSGINLF